MRRLAFVLMLLLCASVLWGQRWQLTILHTNDLHGMMLPFNYPGQYFFTPQKADAGGLARRASAIAQIKAQITDHPVVLVDAGDLFTRGPWHTRFYGEPEIEALNLIGYDMMCVGNNEFKAKPGPESQQIFHALRRRSKSPWLAANLTVSTTGKPVAGVQPYIVKSYGNMRVGFLGLTLACAQSYPQIRGWTISDPSDHGGEGLGAHCPQGVRHPHCRHPPWLCARPRGTRGAGERHRRHRRRPFPPLHSPTGDGGQPGRQAGADCAGGGVGGGAGPAGPDVCEERQRLAADRHAREATGYRPPVCGRPWPVHALLQRYLGDGRKVPQAALRPAA